MGLGASLAVALYGGFCAAIVYGLYKWRTRRRRTSSVLEDAPSSPCVTSRDKIEQIEAEPGVDYRGPGRSGEPLFASGALAVVARVVFYAALAYLLKEPIVWLIDAIARAGR